MTSTRNPLQLLQQDVSQWQKQKPKVPRVEGDDGKEDRDGHPSDDSLVEIVEGARAQVAALADRWQWNEETKKTLLDCRSSHVSHLQSEVLRVEDLESETAEQLSLRQKQLNELAEQTAEISSSAQVVASKENERDALDAKKNLYYMVTRIVWNKSRGEEDKVKGFVVNPIKNDVTTFTVNREEQADVNSTNFLWDYIASGVSSHV